MMNKNKYAISETGYKWKEKKNNTAIFQRFKNVKQLKYLCYNKRWLFHKNQFSFWNVL